MVMLMLCRIISHIPLGMCNAVNKPALLKLHKIAIYSSETYAFIALPDSLIYLHRCWVVMCRDDSLIHRIPLFAPSLHAILLNSNDYHYYIIILCLVKSFRNYLKNILSGWA